MDGIKLNEGQRAAVEAIRSGKNVFLTGEGGTGKSVTVGRAVSLLRSDGREVAICAPTGVAAQNVRGATIHSAFGFSLAPKVADELEGVSPSKVVRAADTIIIDEVGMVRRDLMDAIAMAVEIDNDRRARIPGARRLQLVVVGDFSQLPPVVTKADKPALVAHYGQESADSGFYAFEADGWRRMSFVTCQLTEPMRQSDPVFVAMLNRARIGDQSCLSYFNHLAGRGEVPDKAVSLVGKNKVAAEVNESRLTALRGDRRVFSGTVVGEFKGKDMVAQQSLALKVGARVMIVANDADAGYANGSTGTVDAFDAVDASGVPCIAVKLDGSGAVVKVKRKTWENVRYAVEADGDEKKHLVQEVVGRFTQYPLKLAWAITFHKSQGQTLESVVIDPSTFAPGQLYVGLSRATSADGIWLMRPIKGEDLIADDDVTQFYERECGWVPPKEASGDEVPVLENKNTVVSYSDPKLPQTFPDGIEEVQAELHDLLGAGGRTWVRVYELLDHVAKMKLFRPAYRSFSAWVRAEAEREGVAESLLWHRKSAGDFYCGWADGREGAPKLAEGSHLSEDNLNLVRKIAKIDGARGDELMGELVESGLSTKELRRELRDAKRRVAEPEDKAASLLCAVDRKALSIAFADEAMLDRAIRALEAAGIVVEEVWL